VPERLGILLSLRVWVPGQTVGQSGQVGAPARTVGQGGEVRAVAPWSVGQVGVGGTPGGRGKTEGWSQIRPWVLFSASSWNNRRLQLLVTTCP